MESGVILSGAGDSMLYFLGGKCANGHVHNVGVQSKNGEN